MEILERFLITTAGPGSVVFGTMILGFQLFLSYRMKGIETKIDTQVAQRLDSIGKNLDQLNTRTSVVESKVMRLESDADNIRETAEEHRRGTEKH